MRPSLVAHVVGARPNFVKAAPVIGALESRSIEQRLIHTGQHYDAELSDILFRDLRLRAPDIRLEGGSGTPARQLGQLMAGLEESLGVLRPDLVVLYGDVSSTLAGALVARGLDLPIAHVESGLRSFDLTMPEEVNRRITDMLAELLFTTSPEAAANLADEGIETGRIHHVGNPMIDSLLAMVDRLEPRAARTAHRLPERYAVATIHRPSNVDRAADAELVVKALADVARAVPVALPLHPRGRSNLEAAGLEALAGVKVLPPLGYVEFLSLVRGATLVLTDSGGVQEETTMLEVPCLTLRANTERPITISHGTNRLVTPASIGAAAAEVLEGRAQFTSERPPLWDGHAGERITGEIASWLRSRMAR